MVNAHKLFSKKCKYWCKYFANYAHKINYKNINLSHFMIINLNTFKRKYFAKKCPKSKKFFQNWDKFFYFLFFYFFIFYFFIFLFFLKNYKNFYPSSEKFFSILDIF